MAAAAVVACAGIVLACNGDFTETGRALERDSAGITIIENKTAYPQWHLAPEPDVRIGVVQGDSAYQFYGVRFAGRLSDGRIVVANGGTGQIRFYGSDGAFRSTLGRPGQGPNEFAGIGSVLLTAADTLVVHDPRNQRVTWVGPDERIQREEPLRQVSYGPVAILDVTSNGGLALAESRPTFDLSHPDLSYTRDTLTILIQHASAIDTITRRPGREGILWVQYSGGRPSKTQQMGMPFGYEAFAAARNERIVLALGDRNELQFLNVDGSVTRIARRADVPRTPLTAQDRQQYVGYAVEQARKAGQANVGAVAKTTNDLLAVIPADHTLPPFDRLLADSEGRFWVRDFVPQSRSTADHSWTVYGSNGHIQARVSLPAGLNVMHAGHGYLTGVVRDSLDVEYVVAYRLEQS
jgi:hypothetical protein